MTAAPKTTALDAIGQKRICEMSAEEYRKLVAKLNAAIKEKPKKR
jgi:uncharacterized protein (DUF1778 family)